MPKKILVEVMFSSQRKNCFPSQNPTSVTALAVNKHHHCFISTDTMPRARGVFWAEENKQSWSSWERLQIGTTTEHRVLLKLNRVMAVTTSTLLSPTLQIRWSLYHLTSNAQLHEEIALFPFAFQEWQSAGPVSAKGEMCRCQEVTPEGHKPCRTSRSLQMVHPNNKHLSWWSRKFRHRCSCSASAVRCRGRRWSCFSLPPCWSPPQIKHISNWKSASSLWLTKPS